MRLKLTMAALAAAVSMSLLGAAGASAATEAGSKCLGNAPGGNLTAISVANAPGSGISPTIPVGGVITRWTYNTVPLPPNTYSTSLKVFRRAGGPEQFRVIADSGFAPLSGGLNTFSTRIPVQAGDLVGSFGQEGGNPFTIICTTPNPGDKAALIEGNPPVGSTATALGEIEGLQVPLTVSVEPDADNDGFGDETQDACPQSAAVQVACPVVALSTSTQVKKNSVTVIVTSSVAAPVSVKGVANLGKGKKAKLNAGVQNMVPGTLSKFKLFFPKGMKNKLKELTPKQKLTLKVTVTGTSVSGAVTTKTLKVKLKGQAKP